MNTGEMVSFLQIFFDKGCPDAVGLVEGVLKTGVADRRVASLFDWTYTLRGLGFEGESCQRDLFIVASGDKGRKTTLEDWRGAYHCMYDSVPLEDYL